MNENNNLREVLRDLRDRINNIDDTLIELLNQRGNIVIKVGDLKEKLNLKVFQPQREQEIIDRLKAKSKIIKGTSIEAIWNEIMSASKLIQGSITRTGFLGPEGTFTHQAALEYFPKAGTDFSTFNNTLEIFESIEKGIIDFGVVPIENSLQGTVRETLDLLIEKNLFIYGEIELRIIQNLISLKTSDVSKVRTIISHPQAFAQARKWIIANLPKANLINANSTADAVQQISEQKDESIAAIGTSFSSTIYNLKILSSNIEDNPINFTRFLIISKKENEQKVGKIKTSIVFVTKHTPGALYRALKIFADAKINLLKIESRPRRRGRWEYIFLMDFEGDKEDPQVTSVIAKMSDNVIWHKILGSYPMVK
ncbi:MAG: prephenate dehydratase [Promethearchaeota archaeon]|jgi:chorismate mutase/prephenate dehydratase